MTTSTATLPDLQRDDVIKAALYIAGYLESSMQPTPADVAMATQLFRLLLDSLQAEGVILRTIERTILPLVSGQSEYPLDSDTIDVDIDQDGVAGMIIPTQGTGESPVMAMRANEWMQIGNKQVGPSRPTSVYIEKLAGITAVFYPPPGSESASFRYRRVRLLKDVDTGIVTQDLPSRWTYATAHGLAVLIARSKSLPIARIQELKSEYKEAKFAARNEDVERGPSRLKLVHNGRNCR
jgi:hypothetical protein